MLGILTGLVRGRKVPNQGLAQLTSKRGGKNYYKGKGCRPMGRHTSKGYVLMEEKMPVYNIPDLTKFKLRAYVSHTTPKNPPASEAASSPPAAR